MTTTFKIKIISWQVAVMLVFVFLFLRLFVLPELINYPERIPDLLFYYSADELNEIIGNYTSLEQSNYIKSSLIFDFIYPLISASMIYVLSALIFKIIELKSKWLYIIYCMPFVAVFLDYTENIEIIYLIKKLPNFNENIAQLLGWITFSKWIIYGLSIMSPIFVIIYTISYRIRHSIPFKNNNK